MSKKRRRKIGHVFESLSEAVTKWTGSTGAFATALGVIIVWAAVGPIFQYSDTWQLVINTGTTIVTFLMVFLIQATQNRDSEAIQVKLDELIRSIEGAHLALLDLEELEEEELNDIRARYRKLAQRARKDLRRGRADTDVREVQARS